jgi:dipeptidyl aminopeptidase/acylaminoacyl peptidase
MKLNMKLTHIALVCLLLGVLLSVNVWAQAPQKAQIAFYSDRDGNYEIYVMDADGNNQRNLTNNPAAGDLGPAWSPDGKKIVFTSDRDGNNEIYVMDADANNPRRLTNNPAVDDMPRWFDPAVASKAVSPAGKLGTTWGQIKYELFSR